MKFTKNDLILRALGRANTFNSLYYFNKYILQYPDINRRIHKPMCDFFQPPSGFIDNDYVLDLEPRNTMKTTFCVIGCNIWELAKDQNSRHLIICSSHEEAKKRLKAIKDRMVNSKLLPYFYVDLGRTSKSKTSWKAESIIVYGRTSLDLEPSIDTGGRGTDKTGNHYNRQFIDDLENEKTTREDTDERENTKLNFRRLSPCLLPQKSCQRISGTRWAFDDYYSMILGEDEVDRGQYDFFRTRITAARLPDGTLWYPERLTAKLLERERKIMGDYLFGANYMNNPVISGDHPFPPKFATYYYGDFVKQGSAKYIKVQKVICPKDPEFKYVGEEMVQVRLFITVDPALSSERQACYTGITVVGKEIYMNRLWLVEALRIKSAEVNDTIKAIISLWLKYEPLAVVVEDSAYQLSLKSYLEGEAKNQRVYIKVDTVGRNDHRSKTERVLGLSPYWKNNALLIPACKPNTQELDSPVRALLSELYHHPNPRTRDLSDAFSRILDVQYGVQSKGASKKIIEAEEAYRKAWT